MRPRSRFGLGGVELEFGEVTYVMGVINLSPESKNTHTVATGIDEAVALARRYRRWGATIIDLGGQSSHYDNPTIDSSLELARLLPVVDALLADGFLVSVDTWKPDVAREAIAEGRADHQRHRWSGRPRNARDRGVVGRGRRGRLCGG